MPQYKPTGGDEQGKPLGTGRSLIQYAALPFRLVDDEPEVMLVTSRETKRWILPKGNPKKNVPSYLVAAEEAFEEAGLKGKPGETPFFTFDSSKRMKSGKQVSCRVRVFALKVTKEYASWPEKGQRERAWMSFAEAAHNVGEAGLVLLFLELAADPALALARISPVAAKDKGQIKAKEKDKDKSKSKVTNKPSADKKALKSKIKVKDKAQPKAKAKAISKAEIARGKTNPQGAKGKKPSPAEGNSKSRAKAKPLGKAKSKAKKGVT